MSESDYPDYPGFVPMFVLWCHSLIYLLNYSSMHFTVMNVGYPKISDFGILVSVDSRSGQLAIAKMARGFTFWND